VLFRSEFRTRLTSFKAPTFGDCAFNPTRRILAIKGLPSAILPFESLFEQHVFYKIKEWGYRVVPQYNVAGYRIDLVVSGMQGQLAVECDGDRWHGPEQYEADMERQRQLERCGWTFWRIRASSFYRDPDGAMETLWEKLNRLNIYPSTEDERKGMAKDKDEEAVSMPVENGDITEKRKDDDAFETRPINGFQGKVISLNERRKADKMDNSDDNAKAKTIQNPDVKEYTSWEPEPLPDPRDASLQEIIEGLVKIVAVEGPIFVHRVFRLYLKAAGLGRLGDYLKNALLRALQKAITKGLLVESNELEVRDKLARVVRLPNTPRVILRTRGDRALEEIPPSEITAVINLFHKQNIVSLDEKEMLFRAVLDHYGFGRMTQKARQILKSTLQMAQQGNEFFRQ